MPDYFEFEIALRDVTPRIWRRILLKKSSTFHHLHEAIQDACGWCNCHLFLFQDPDGEPIAGLPDDEYGEPDPDARKVKLTSHFGAEKNTRAVYLYDFGDSWEHDVTLVDTKTLAEKFTRRLLDGARAFPREDCGSITGYLDCCKVALGKKKNAELREWMGAWHPEKFDLAVVREYFDQ